MTLVKGKKGEVRRQGARAATAWEAKKRCERGPRSADKPDSRERARERTCARMRGRKPRFPLLLEFHAGLSERSAQSGSREVDLSTVEIAGVDKPRCKICLPFATKANKERCMRHRGKFAST